MPAMKFIQKYLHYFGILNNFVYRIFSEKLTYTILRKVKKTLEIEFEFNACEQL